LKMEALAIQMDPLLIFGHQLAISLIFAGNMQFLYPSFLWALGALAIPIIIHLFYFRRFKKVYFTNVRFLREVKEETSARRKLRNLLVLMMRVLALAFLVLAFAQPFIPQDAEVKKGEKSVSVFIDNSFSMESLSEDVPLIEKAKQRAREIINAYNVEDRFQILTNDFEGRHQRLLSKEDALSMIDEVKISPSVKELSKVLVRQQQALNSGRTDNKVSYVISDFQKNITDVQDYRDTLVAVNFIPLQSVQEKNISIDSCWFVAPVQMLNQTNTLIVRVRNHSDQAAENIRLSLRHEGQVKPVGTLSIPPGASVTDSVNITILRTGWHQAELSITDFPVQFDDKYFFGFNVAEKIDMLVINGDQSNNYLDAAFSGINYIALTNASSRSLDYSSFPNYQLLIVNGLNDISSGLAFELNQYVRNGGNLLLFPPYNAAVSSYKSFLNTLQANELKNFDQQERVVSGINTDEFVFNDVFENRSANLRLPVTQGNFVLTNYTSRGEEPLLTYRDGSTYLAKYRRDQGNFYLCTAPLGEDYNNLVRSGEVFIPMLYKMAISTAKARQIAYTIGRDEVLEAENRLSGSEMVYKMKGAQEEFIPEQKIIGAKVILGVNNQVSEAGIYQLFLQKESTLSEYAFNYDRKESILDYYNEGDLSELVGEVIKVLDVKSVSNLTPLIGERSQGIILWRWCLILALLFLALEVLVLRFWRV
ncbi:MAG: BatA domain-containing protein, partial [Bacteroidota bacterium]